MPKIGFKWATLALYMLISGFAGIILFIYDFFIADVYHHENVFLNLLFMPVLITGYIFQSYGWVALLPMLLVHFIYFSFLGFPLYLFHILIKCLTSRFNFQDPKVNYRFGLLFFLGTLSGIPAALFLKDLIGPPSFNNPYLLFCAFCYPVGMLFINKGNKLRKKQASSQLEDPSGHHSDF